MGELFDRNLKYQPAFFSSPYILYDPSNIIYVHSLANHESPRLGSHCGLRNHNYFHLKIITSVAQRKTLIQYYFLIFYQINLAGTQCSCFRLIDLKLKVHCNIVYRTETSKIILRIIITTCIHFAEQHDLLWRKRTINIPPSSHLHVFQNWWSA